MFSRLTAATFIALVSTPALAQEPAKPADEAKPITRTEISARLDSDYSDLDANKDGKVDAAEINGRLKKSAEAEVELIKKERDGAFAKFDTNSDGSISRAEFDARAKLPTIQEPDAKPFLERFDANKDGSITQEEFRTPTLANFTKLDSNKDGTLSIAEQKTASASPAGKKIAPKQTPSIGR